MNSGLYVLVNGKRFELETHMNEALRAMVRRGYASVKVWGPEEVIRKMPPVVPHAGYLHSSGKVELKHICCTAPHPAKDMDGCAFSCARCELCPLCEAELRAYPDHPHRGFLMGLAVQYGKPGPRYAIANAGSSCFMDGYATLDEAAVAAQIEADKRGEAFEAFEIVGAGEQGETVVRETRRARAAAVRNQEG